MSEKYMITGGLGCIGAWVTRLLVSEGIPVVVLDPGTRHHRLELLLTEEQLRAVSLVSTDITDLDEVEAAIDESQITNVIHLGALQIPFCRANPPLGAAVNVVGTVNLLEAVHRRADRMGPFVYAGSLAMFDRSDLAEDDGALQPGTDAHPRTHYGVYKQANEGNAEVYWLEHALPSVALRPMTVYGPGRDQGMTSTPTVAMLAAALGKKYHSPFGGRTLFNYTEDVAASFIAASKASPEGAITVDLPGATADMHDVVAAMERVVPGATDLITYEEQVLPFPDRIGPDQPSPLGELPLTALEDGVAATIAMFQEKIAAGGFSPEAHGLA